MPMTGLPDGAFLLRDPVVVRDGVLQVMLGGRVVPLFMGDAPVAAFRDGWRAIALSVGFAPVLLLELEHESGERATWFLDHRLHFLANTVQAMPATLLSVLRQRSLPVVQALMRQVLESGPLTPDPAVTAFLALNDRTRNDVGLLHWSVLVNPPLPCRIGELAGHALVQTDDTGMPCILSREHLAAGLARDWQDRLREGLDTGGIDWPSPIDGVALPAQGSIVLDDFHFAYRFADLRHDLVFFVLASDHLSCVSGIWLPKLGLIIGEDGVQFRHVTRMAALICGWVFGHTLGHAPELVPCLRDGPAGFTTILRGLADRHIGHQLWNELSGIDRALADRPRTLPEVVVLNADRGNELYGPIDRLFPEFEGRVERGIGSHPALAAHLYRRRLLGARFATDFVSTALRNRITTFARGRSDWRRPAGDRSLRLLFGLRVENRTLADLDGFLVSLVAMLADRYPGATLVFDGHNASHAGDGGIVESNAERLATRAPIDVERDLVAASRRQAEGLPLSVLDTIGLSVVDSIAAAASCDGFVSIWGGQPREVSMGLQPAGLRAEQPDQSGARDAAYL